MNRARIIQRARTNRLEAEAMRRDEAADVASIPTNMLWAAIYRLQSRNRTGAWSARIRELSAEHQRRRAATA